MPKLFPADRRLTVKLIYERVNSIRKTAIIMQVSKSTVQRWLVMDLMVLTLQTKIDKDFRV